MNGSVGMVVMDAVCIVVMDAIDLFVMDAWVIFIPNLNIECFDVMIIFAHVFKSKVEISPVWPVNLPCDVVRRDKSVLFIK